MMFGVFSFIFPLVCVISAAKERCDFHKFDCDTRDPCSPTLCTPGVTLYEGRGANYHVQCHATEGCHTVECPATTIYDYDDNQCVSKFPDRCNAEEFNCGSNNPCAHELCVAGQSRYPNRKANRYVQCTEDGTCGTRKCPRGQIFSTIEQDCVNDEPSDLGQCEVEEANRVQCEADNVNQEECELNACCWEEGTSAPTCFYSNYEVSGYITRSTGCAGLTPFSEAAVSRLECAQTCYGDSQCVRFEYHDQLENNQCKLFSDSCKVSTIAGVFSYDKVAAPGYRCRRGDCPGDDLFRQQFNVDSQECKRLCDANPSCLLYLTVYLDWASHMCYLKDTVCDPTLLSTQPGQICDRETNGVQVQTADDDYTDVDVGAVADASDGTCTNIPLSDSSHQYLTARLPFPTLNSADHSFIVTVVGENLQCARRFTSVSMKVGVTWGDPAFDFNDQCRADSESVDGALTTCTYFCNPSSYAEAAFVTMSSNVADATVCDISAGPVSA